MKLRLLAMLLLNTLVLPLLIIYLLRQLRLISSFTLEKRKDRIYPFLIIILLFIAIYYRMSSLPLPNLLSWSLLAMIAVLLSSFIANFFKKISIHCAGLTGVAGILFATSPQSAFQIYFPLSVVIGAAGLTGTARLILDVHTTEEVYLGYAIGWFSAWVAFFFIG